MFFIAASDRMSWGRGTVEWEAIAHAISHGGDSVKNVILFQVDCPDGFGETSVVVNELGSIVAPAGSEIKEIGSFDVTECVESFLDFKSQIALTIY